MRFFVTLLEEGTPRVIRGSGRHWPAAEMKPSPISGGVLVATVHHNALDSLESGGAPTRIALRLHGACRAIIRMSCICRRGRLILYIRSGQRNML